MLYGVCCVWCVRCVVSCSLLQLCYALCVACLLCELFWAIYLCIVLTSYCYVLCYVHCVRVVALCAVLCAVVCCLVYHDLGVVNCVVCDVHLELGICGFCHMLCLACCDS